MNDVVGDDKTPVPNRPETFDTSSPKASGSAGSMLRAARESRGLHVAHLATMLKVPVQRLQALEDDRYELLPDMVFARALYSSACRCLKVDAEPLLALLPSAGVRRMLGDDEGLNARFGGSGRALPAWPVLQVSRPIVWLVGLMVVAIAGVALWPLQDDLMDATVPVETLLPAAPLTQSEAGPGGSLASAPVNMAEPVTSGSVEPKAVSSLTSAAEVAPPVAAAATTAQPAVASPAPASAPVLSLQVKGEAWILVRDAQGVEQVHKIAQTGEVLNVSGALPLSVVLGRADAVEVSVRGQRLDTTEMTKGNVARFEVK